MAHIYKITSPSKKIYVGSSTDINERFRSYKRLHCKSQVRLYNSFIKYGIDNHKFEIITECTIEEMLNLESYYGNIYNSLSKNGLNCFLPKKDDNFICRSEETRKKISENNKGKKLSDVTKQKLRLANIGKPSPNKGKSVHSIESKIKMSKSHTGKKFNELHKKNISESLKGKLPKNFHTLASMKSKIILDTSNGIFHNSITDAAIFYKVSASYISLILSCSRKNKLNLISV
jgi:group I intron endonuclease